MASTKYIVEQTDTFGGEANYSYVNRVEIEVKNDASNLALVRKAKKEIGWNGLRCQTTDYGDMIEIRPQGLCQIVFIYPNTTLELENQND